MPNKKLPGTEQTVLNVIAWVRSQVYRHSPLAWTDLLQGPAYEFISYLRTFVYV